MKTLGILGTGLLGASIGLRAHERGYHVVGHDISDDALTIAKQRNAIDAAVERDAVYAADVTVISLPVNATIAELTRRRSIPGHDASLIIDIASVKVPIVKAANGLAGFVATHPFAGREKSGAQAADATLFDGKPWVYVSSGNNKLDVKAEEFLREMGGLPLAVNAVQHDAICACTSHLPQLLAWLFADRYAEEDPALIASLSGPVARELQRIARSEPQMWREIFRANTHNLIRESRAMSEALTKAADAFERGDDVI